MLVESRALADLSADDRRQVEEVDRQSVSEMPPDEYVWFTDYPYRVLVKLDGALVSTLGIVVRRVKVGGRPVVVGGVGNVGTLRAYRRQGCARTALDEAIRYMGQDLGAQFGFLFCEPEMEAFYSRLGWQRVAAPVQFDQPAGKVTYPKPAMIRPCGDHTWPEGPVDCCGLPW